MNQPIGYQLKKITDKIKVSADTSLKSRNLTLSQVCVLEYIANQGGKVTQKSTEEYLNVAHPTVVGIVSRMEKNEYLVCYADSRDKRNKVVELTRKAEYYDARVSLIASRCARLAADNGISCIL